MSLYQSKILTLEHHLSTLLSSLLDILHYIRQSPSNHIENLKEQLDTTSTALKVIKEQISLYSKFTDGYDREKLIDDLIAELHIEHPALIEKILNRISDNWINSPSDITI